MLHDFLLTDHQIVYLPEKSTPELQSFSAPLLNLHDTHLTVPWFGPNAWLAVLQPVPGGNIPSAQAAIEVKLTFKEGGAPDFHSNFERIKERLQQVVSDARESNLTGSSQGNVFSDANLDNVHLDELPSYQDSGHDRVAPVGTQTEAVSPVIVSPTPIRPSRPAQTTPQPPNDAPPGYEETQQQSVQAELERRLSGGRDEDEIV
jgi:WW domain-binding protein 2